jgi:hypothetical protein
MQRLKATGRPGGRPLRPFCRLRSQARTLRPHAFSPLTRRVAAVIFTSMQHTPRHPRHRQSPQAIALVATADASRGNQLLLAILIILAGLAGLISLVDRALV